MRNSRYDKYISLALTIVAVVLVPVGLYLGIHVLPHAHNPYVAYWAPIAVLALDTLLFYIALGTWKLDTWDRAGIALVLPLLLAMASWAVMINTITSQMPPPQMIQGD